MGLIDVYSLLLSLASLYIHSDQSVKILFVMEGDTAILNQSIRGQLVRWYGPFFGYNYQRQIDVVDRYNRKTSWNVSHYTENNQINPNLVSFGIDNIGLIGNDEYTLQVSNITMANEGLYLCDTLSRSAVYRSCKERYVIQIRNKHDLRIDPVQHISIVEGKNINICCSMSTVLSYESSHLRWFDRKRGKEIQVGLNKTCLYIPKIDRNDGAAYTCINELGTEVKNASINVLFPPGVSIKYRYNKQDNSTYALQCQADGNPDTYIYGKWEHMSFFNEHVRDIPSSKNGIIYLNVTKHRYKWYDNDGLYVCKVSNNVPDRNGNYFQLGTARLTAKGPPVFIANNRKIQETEEVEPKNISITVYNTSTLTCSYITLGNDLIPFVEVKMQPRNASDFFYQKKITIIGTYIIFIFYNSSFGEYMVTVCNQYGSNSFKVELRQKGKHETSSDIQWTNIVELITFILLSIFGAYSISHNFDRRIQRNVTIEMEDHEYNEISDVISTNEHTSRLPQQFENRSNNQHTSETIQRIGSDGYLEATKSAIG